MIVVTPLVLSWGILLGAPAASVEGDRPGFPFFQPVQPPRAIEVMAHHGALNPAPENTAQALEFSIADGLEWVAVDVRITKDGHHVLFDVDELQGKTDGSGPLRAHSLAEIQSFDAGSPVARRFAGARILTLAECLTLARGRINLCLELQDVDAAQLAREIIAAKMARQVVLVGKPEVVQAVRAAATEELAVMMPWRPKSDINRWADEVRPAAVAIDAVDVTPDACRAFHRCGIKVQAKVRSPDDRPEVWDRMIAAGVDWLQTDRPEEVLARQALKITRGRRPKIAHHRGASRYAPENTLPALEKAIRLGADFVEFDVRTTRDGRHVLLHDSMLNRTTHGRGAVRDQEASAIAALDAGTCFGRVFRGTTVPSLDAFLEAAGRRVELYVNAKDIAPEALAEVLSRHGLIEQAVVYQSVAYLEELRRIEPRIRRMPPLRDLAKLDAAVDRVQPYAFDTQWSILSKELIDRCHARGVKVFSDALGLHESLPDYQRAIRDGIDVIQSDFPLRVLRAIELTPQND